MTALAPISTARLASSADRIPLTAKGPPHSAIIPAASSHVTVRSNWLRLPLSDTGWPEQTSSCQIPVGDYAPNYLSMRFGRLAISAAAGFYRAILEDIEKHVIRQTIRIAIDPP